VRARAALARTLAVLLRSKPQMKREIPNIRWLPSWRNLSFRSRTPLFKASLAMTIIVPMWARLIDLAGSVEPQQNGLHLLDSNILAIPDNLLRLFWASFAVSLAGILYSLTCPIVLRRYRSYQQWLDLDEEANVQRSKLLNQRGSDSLSEIDIELKDSYIRTIAGQSFTYPWIRFTIALLYVVASYLIIRVMATQIASVWTQTSLSALFL